MKIRLCPYCEGEGELEVDCFECNGYGDDEDGEPCEECEGFGYVIETCFDCSGFGDIEVDDGT